MVLTVERHFNNSRRSFLSGAVVVEMVRRNPVIGRRWLLLVIDVVGEGAVRTVGSLVLRRHKAPGREDAAPWSAEFK